MLASGRLKRGTARRWTHRLAVPFVCVAESVAPTAAASAPQADLAFFALPLQGSGAFIRANQQGFFVEDIEVVPGQEVPVRIRLPSPAELASAGPSAFILIRNMPVGVRFSAGMSSGRLWVLPLQNASHLRLSSERGTAGSFSLEFSLIGSNNRALAKQTVALDLKPAEAALPGTGAATAPKLPPEEVAALLARGEDLLRQGGIAAARIIFENLAQRGYAPAAFALGRSYDPTFVPDSRISAPAADLDKALKWYQRAEELGSTEAREQIAKLSSGR
jgi:hypothetical protein